ncbi:MAG: cellulase family glycosylhydrolase [Defluviitaleaceae bacterium]|nr:cellulase family glycosylhydrolase [Defluviitaleaceae bacterium]
MKRKILAFTLTLTMLFGLIAPVTASAAQPQPGDLIWSFTASNYNEVLGYQNGFAHWGAGSIDTEFYAPGASSSLRLQGSQWSVGMERVNVLDTIIVPGGSYKLVVHAATRDGGHHVRFGVPARLDGGDESHANTQTVGQTTNVFQPFELVFTVQENATSARFYVEPIGDLNIDKIELFVISLPEPPIVDPKDDPIWSLTESNYNEVINRQNGFAYWGEVSIDTAFYAPGASSSLRLQGGQWAVGMSRLSVLNSIVVLGGTYKMVVYAATRDGGHQVRFGVPANLDYSEGEDHTNTKTAGTTTNEFQPFELIFTVLENTTNARFYIEPLYDLNIDKIELFVISLPEEPIVPTPTPAPLPTTNPDPGKPNLLPNGNFADTSQFGPNDWLDWMYWSDDGGQNMYFINDATFGNVLVVPAVGFKNFHNYRAPMVGGELYQLHVTYRAVGTLANASAGASYGWSGSQAAGSFVALTTNEQWTVASVVFRAEYNPLWGAAGVNIRLDGGGGTLYIAEVKIEVYDGAVVAPTPTPAATPTPITTPDPTPTPPPAALPVIPEIEYANKTFVFDFSGWWGWNIEPDNNNFGYRSPGLRLNATGPWSAGLTHDIAALVKPNTTYMLRGLYKADSAFGFNFGARYQTAAQVISSNETFMMTTLNNTTNWQYGQHIFTMPPAYATAGIYVMSAESNARTHYLSDMELIELKANSVSVAQPPFINTYDTGQALNLNGLILRVGYASVEYVATINVTNDMDGLTVSGYDPFADGMQTVSLTYLGIPFSIDVLVMEGGLDPVAIAPKAHANRTLYWEGEEFDFTGTAFFYQKRNGDSEVITATAAMIDSSAFDKNTKGTYPIVVSYDGFSYTYTATVSGQEHFYIGINPTTGDPAIIDPNGEVFIPLGVNVNGNAMWGGRNGRDSSSVLQDLNLIADIWQFNTIRVVMTQHFNHPNVQNRHWHYDDIDAIVEAFTAKGIVCMLEMHDPLSNFYPDFTQNGPLNGSRDGYPVNLVDFAAEWVRIATKYKDNPYVWINLLNEPTVLTSYGDAWFTAWKNFLFAENGKTYPAGYSHQFDVDVQFYIHDYILTALKEADINNLICINENHYGQSAYNENDPDGPGSFILNKGRELDAKHGKILYALHPYGWADLLRMENFVKDCYARGLMINFGEYGAVWGDLTTHKSTMNVYTVGLQYNVGRLYWDWSNDNMSVVDRNKPGVTGGWGWEIDRVDGTKPTNLSWFGELVWADSRGTLTLPIKRFIFPIIVNGDFANGLSPWHNFGGLRLVQGGSHDLTDCAELMAGHDYTGQALDTDNLIPGATYTLSAWGRLGIESNYYEIGLAFTAVGIEGEPHIRVPEFTSTVWAHHEVTFTLPANDLRTARIYAWGPNGSVPFFFDKVDIVLVYCSDCGEAVCECKDEDPCNVCGEDPCVCVYCDVCGELEDDCTCEVPTPTPTPLPAIVFVDGDDEVSEIEVVLDDEATLVIKISNVDFSAEYENGIEGSINGLTFAELNFINGIHYVISPGSIIFTITAEGLKLLALQGSGFIEDGINVVLFVEDFPVEASFTLTVVPCIDCGEYPCVCEEDDKCEVCGKDPCVCVSIVGYSNAKFISIVETSKNSRVWTLTFSVTTKMSNNTTVVKNFAVALEGNNANLDGVFKFAASHELAGFKLQYDIKGNGSNIKDFKLI